MSLSYGHVRHFSKLNIARERNGIADKIAPATLSDNIRVPLRGANDKRALTSEEGDNSLRRREVADLSGVEPIRPASLRCLQIQVFVAANQMQTETAKVASLSS